MKNVNVKIGIIIPTFNRKERLRVILKQLHDQVVNNGELFFIVVVDGSTDGTIEMLADEFPDVHIVYGSGEWWYTKSMNEGFRYAERFKLDYILTMNDDTEVLPDYIEKSLREINKVEPNSIVGSALFTIDKPHKILFSGQKDAKINLYRFTRYINRLSQVEPDSTNGIYPSFTLTGRGMFIPVSVLKDMNYFDEIFPQYASDTDFCFRALKKGYPIYISWSSHIYSHENILGNAYFKRQSFHEFLRSFFSPYSIASVRKDFILFYRHTKRFLFLPLLFIKVVARFKHYFKYRLLER